MAEMVLTETVTVTKPCECGKPGCKRTTPVCALPRCNVHACHSTTRWCSNAHKKEHLHPELLGSDGNCVCGISGCERMTRVCALTGCQQHVRNGETRFCSMEHKKQDTRYVGKGVRRREMDWDRLLNMLTMLADAVKREVPEDAEMRHEVRAVARRLCRYTEGGGWNVKA